MIIDTKVLLDLSINTWLVASTVLALVSLMEPITTISFYAKLHPEATEREYRKDGKRIWFIVFLSLLFFFFVWQYLLSFFWLQIEYFRIAWGLVLFFIAFSMVKWEESDDTKITKVEGDRAIHEYMNKWLIIPLVFPLTVNTWLISYIVSIHSTWIANWLVSITIASIIVALVIMFGGKIMTRLWEMWVHLIIRLFGLFLLWVAIQTIWENIFKLIHINF